MRTEEEKIRMHNPNGVSVGEHVIMDERAEVIILELTPSNMFAQVTDNPLITDPNDKATWSVMTCRLQKKADAQTIS